jgi:hypothetical protein
LSQLTGAEVWVKFDNLHFTGSFKERGALNRLLQLTPVERTHLLAELAETETEIAGLWSYMRQEAREEEDYERRQRDVDPEQRED